MNSLTVIQMETKTGLDWWDNVDLKQVEVCCVPSRFTGFGLDPVVPVQSAAGGTSRGGLRGTD